MRITNTQKSELADIFRKTGLSLLDFETSGQYKEFKVKFKHEYFSFAINIEATDNFIATIFPVDDLKGYTIRATWQVIKSRFSSWINQIAIELKTPTGWETFQSENFLNAEFNELDEKFSEVEKEQARQSIKELKTKIETLKLPDGALDIINKKLDEITIKVNDLSKFDLKSLLIGSLANLIMVFAIPPEASGLIWEYLKSAFNGLKLHG